MSRLGCRSNSETASCCPRSESFAPSTPRCAFTSGSGSLRGTILDVQGVARLIASGAGAGVLPSHVAERMIREGVALHCFSGSGRPLKNVISLASLRGRSHSAAALAVIEHLKNSL